MTGRRHKAYVKTTVQQLLIGTGVLLGGAALVGVLGYGLFVLLGNL